ncbi:hypothetical protein Cpir12675_006659, partial [Ceratocystis pirilliformis]
MVLRERPRGGTSRRIIENDGDGLDKPYLRVPHKDGRKANIGKAYSAQRTSAARRPPSPVNSRREGQASESSRSHHLPTPGSSRNRTPEFDEDDFDDAEMTEDSDLSRTDSDSEAENFAATNRKPAKSVAAAAATKASLGRRYTSASSGPGDVAPEPAPMSGYSRATVSKAKAGLNTSGSSGNTYHGRKRYETAPSEDDDYSDNDSENFAQEDPAVHSDENDEEADRRIMMQQRHTHSSTGRASFMSDQSQTAPLEVNRWPSKKARSAAENSETTAARKHKPIPRGVTDTASKADKDVFTRLDTAKANPQLE